MIIKIKIERVRREDINIRISGEAPPSRPTRLIIWTDDFFAVRASFHFYRSKLLGLLSLRGAGKNLEAIAGDNVNEGLMKPSFHSERLTSLLD
jgi:hypothetical protein